MSRIATPAYSPAALEGYLGLNGALGEGEIDVKARERIALAVAEIAANRGGGSNGHPGLSALGH